MKTYKVRKHPIQHAFTMNQVLIISQGQIIHVFHIYIAVALNIFVWTDDIFFSNVVIWHAMMGLLSLKSNLNIFILSNLVIHLLWQLQFDSCFTCTVSRDGSMLSVSTDTLCFHFMFGALHVHKVEWLIAQASRFRTLLKPDVMVTCLYSNFGKQSLPFVFCWLTIDFNCF